MKPPYPAPVNEWHNAPYPDIDPTSAALSHKGQTVVITGAGSGIGQAAAVAYAKAGAAQVILIGRRAAKLDETAKLITDVAGSECKAIPHPASVTKTAELKGIAAELRGGWDVLVLCAGRAPNPATIEQVDPDLWWDVLETNLRGNFSTVHSFLPKRNPGARIVGVSAGLVNLAAAYPPCAGASAYVSSKLAQIRLLEHVAAENQDLHTVSVHPGIVVTDLMKESSMTDGNIEGMLLDDANLSAHFFVWATSKDAAFLRGKYCWANWDVAELKARAKEIQETEIFTSNIIGWPYQAKA